METQQDIDLTTPGIVLLKQNPTVRHFKRAFKEDNKVNSFESDEGIMFLAVGLCKDNEYGDVFDKHKQMVYMYPGTFDSSHVYQKTILVKYNNQYHMMKVDGFLHARKNVNVFIITGNFIS